MTKNELSQLYWLGREIKEQQRRLAELESLATSCTSLITGMPHGRGVDNRLAEYVAEIADLRDQINLNLRKCFYELNRLTNYVSGIEDSQIRQIISLRHINGLSWVRIAFALGGDSTADGVRMAYKRYLEKT